MTGKEYTEYIREKVDNVQKDISNHVANVLSKFREETGLRITEIVVDIIETASRMQSGDLEATITDVDTKVHINL